MNIRASSLYKQYCAYKQINSRILNSVKQSLYCFKYAEINVNLMQLSAYYALNIIGESRTKVGRGKTKKRNGWSCGCVKLLRAPTNETSINPARPSRVYSHMQGTVAPSRVGELLVKIT